MEITKAHIRELPYEWARELAEQFDPDARYARDGYDAYGILNENWPECRDNVEELLSQLIAMEAFYEQPIVKEPDDEIPGESISRF